jgi:recombination associated protein RdgC
VFFRNVTWFRFPRDLSLANLSSGLEQCGLKPVGPMELVSTGFVAPLGHDHFELEVESGRCRWISVGQEKRVLPPAVVEKEVRDRMRAAEEKCGLKLSGRQRKRYREEVVADLLPKAFVEPRRTNAYIDAARGLIAIDTSSRKLADGVVSQVRDALGSFPALPLAAELAPHAVLTGWLAGDTMPEGFVLGDECTLQDPADKGSAVRMVRKDLASEEVQKHLEAGMQCTRLALVWKDHLSFTLDEDLALRKVRFLEGAVEALDDKELDSLRMELEARFALLHGELGQLFDALASALAIVSADDQPSVQAPTLEGDDPLYAIAVQTVVETQRASISSLQRRLKTGYNRAARLIESMELNGIVSAPTAEGDRTVLQAHVPPALPGIATVEIRVAGSAPVTVTAEQFSRLGRVAQRLGEVLEWIRDNERVTGAGTARHLGCGLSGATQVLTTLESAGVLMRDGEYWIPLAPGASA